MTFTLRRVTTHVHVKDAYQVFLGDLLIGKSVQPDAADQQQVWRLGFSSVNRVEAQALGDADVREDAMADFRAAWDRIMTPADIVQMQDRADFTTYKYAVYDVGGAFETVDPAGTFRFRRCSCGAMLDCWDQAAVMPHVAHLNESRRP